MHLFDTQCQKILERWGFSADHCAEAILLWRLDGWYSELPLSLSKVMMGKPICWVQVSIMAATSTLPLIALLRAFQRSLFQDYVHQMSLPSLTWWPCCHTCACSSKLSGQFVEPSPQPVVLTSGWWMHPTKAEPNWQIGKICFICNTPPSAKLDPLWRRIYSEFSEQKLIFFRSFQKINFCWSNFIHDDFISIQKYGMHTPKHGQKIPSSGWELIINRERQTVSALR